MNRPEKFLPMIVLQAHRGKKRAVKPIDEKDVEISGLKARLAGKDEEISVLKGCLAGLGL